MSDYSIKTSELSSRTILTTANTKFLILDTGVYTQGSQGSTMLAPASALMSLVANTYNLYNLPSLYSVVSNSSANNLSNFSTVNTNSATWVNHVANSSIHLTSEESTLLANLSATYTELNYSIGVTSPIQDQFTTINADISALQNSSSNILRAIGTVQASTTPGAPAAPPPDITFQFQGLTSGASFDITFTTLGGTTTYTFALSNPSTGSVWIDSTFLSTPNDYAQAFWAQISSNTSLSKVVDDTNGLITIATSDVGSTSVLAGNATAYCVITGGGIGTDLGAPTGGISNIYLASAVTGKTIKMINAWYDGSITGGMQVALYLDNIQISGLVNANTYGNFSPTQGRLVSWVNPLSAGQALIARLVNGTDPVDSSTCIVGAIFEQS